MSEKSNQTDTLLRRIQAIMPRLKIEQVEINDEGLINDVVIVNNSLVFRFAKTETYAGILDIEVKILDLVRPQVGVDIPAPMHTEHGCIVYPFLSGQALLRETILGLDRDDQTRVVEQLGQFLHALHTTAVSDLAWDIPATRAPVTRKARFEMRQRVREKVYPLLLAHQIQWAENLFSAALENPGFFDYEPALIHGDLAPYHILFDDLETRIAGVIDFGVAGVGDAALDIGSLINAYGESFVAKMTGAYTDLEKYLPRARFHAQAIELEWVLLGIETGQTFWYTAHLGSARDIQGV